MEFHDLSGQDVPDAGVEPDEIAGPEVPDQHHCGGQDLPLLSVCRNTHFSYFMLSTENKENIVFCFFLNIF